VSAVAAAADGEDVIIVFIAAGLSIQLPAVGLLVPASLLQLEHLN
jgi:hypothetical protein